MEQNSVHPITHAELERIADHVKAMKSKCERYEAALKEISSEYPDGLYAGDTAREALSAGERGSQNG